MTDNRLEALLCDALCTAIQVILEEDSSVSESDIALFVDVDMVHVAYVDACASLQQP